MNHNELYNNFKQSGLSLSAFAKLKGLDKGNLSRTFKKFTNDNGVVGVVDTTDTTGVVGVVTTDCNCENNKKELVAALLEISDLRAELADLRAEKSNGAESAPLLPTEKDCSACEKLAEIEMQVEDLRAEMQAKDQGLNEKEKIISMLKVENRDIKSSLDTERKERERIESALSKIEAENNSLKAETKAGKAEVERLQSVVENTKKELAEAYAEAYNKSGIPLWLIFIGVLSAVALFLLGTWV